MYPKPPVRACRHGVCMYPLDALRWLRDTTRDHLPFPNISRQIGQMSYHHVGPSVVYVTVNVQKLFAARFARGP